jgi:Tol biopolymer transport system component
VSATGQEATLTSSNARFSPDGRYVVFDSFADNLSPEDGDNRSDIFLKDLRTGAVTVVSTKADGEKANGHCYDAHFSANGRYVLFTSIADNLVAGDTNNKEDIFRKDLQTGEIVRVSTSGTGTESNGTSIEARISADGRYVVFISDAGNLVAGDTNGVWDVFRKDLVTGETIRLSTSATGVETDQVSGWGVEMSADGRSVILGTGGSFVPGDANNMIDLVRVDAELMSNASAVVAGRYVELRFGVGSASSINLAWGDGSGYGHTRGRQRQPQPYLCE